MSNESSWMNLDETTLEIRNFDMLGQPEWILHFFSLYHVLVVVMCIVGICVIVFVC